MNHYRLPTTIINKLQVQISSKRITKLQLQRLTKQTMSTKDTKHITSKMSNIELPSVPILFKRMCIGTGLSITIASLYLLQENLLFGTVAGITAKTCTAPLERLTTHRQASIDPKCSLLSIIREIYNEENIFGFWRGNGINVFRASIQKGSLFALNDLFRSLICNTPHNDSFAMSFISGSMAGLVSTLITYPLDPVKTVNQATIHSQRWPSMSIWYSLSINKGYLNGPWTAALPTFCGTTLYYGIKFMSFEMIINRINGLSVVYDVEIQRDLRNATGGLLSGIIGNSITYPNNCIRKRMQTSHVLTAIGIESGYNAEKYFKTAVTLYREGGIQRFYRGFFINLCRNAPNTAIQFVVYKRLQIIWNRTEHSQTT